MRVSHYGLLSCNCMGLEPPHSQPAYHPLGQVQGAQVRCSIYALRLHGSVCSCAVWAQAFWWCCLESSKVTPTSGRRHSAQQNGYLSASVPTQQSRAEIA